MIFTSDKQNICENNIPYMEEGGGGGGPKAPKTHHLT